ncbi:MAG: hypothetical protein M3Y56_08415 [Armatimonadota bacterium]|nr:hypothetical protein [Armatimonadota bacterium]
MIFRYYSSMDAIPVCPNPEASLPLPATGAKPAAVAHAPTLIAAAAGSSGGAVRVWYPDKGAHLKTWARAAVAVALLVSPLAFLTLLPSFFTSLYGLLLVMVFWPLIAGFATLCPPWALRKSSLWRPCYVSTDDTGMAVNSLSGNLTIRWDDIVGCFHKNMIVEDLFVLFTHTHGPVPIELWGFRPSESRELTALITRRANLTIPAGSRNPLWPLSWCSVRPGYKILPPGRIGQVKQAALPPAAGSR